MKQFKKKIAVKEILNDVKLPCSWLPKNPIKASIATTGLRVTTYMKFKSEEFNGVGMGYLYNGVVYKSGGNGYYYDAAHFGPTPITAYIIDNGKGYRDKINSIILSGGLPPTYKI